MTWTKSQKISGAVLGLAAVAFGVDRWVLSAPESADAAGSADEFVVKKPAATASAPSATVAVSTASKAAAATTTPATAQPAASALTLASRLSAMGVARRFDFEPVGDAFRPDPSWFPEEEKQADAEAAKAPTAAAPKPAKPKVDYAALFAQGHELTAVMSNAEGGMAIVNGKVYVPGQTVGGFKLTQVGEQHATFAGKGTKATLRLRSAPGATPPVADAR